MDEFSEIHKYFIGCVDEKGNPVVERTSFAEVEYKYFEGLNIPRRIIDGEMEDFDEAYARVKRYYAIPYEQRKVYLTT